MPHEQQFQRVDELQARYKLPGWSFVVQTRYSCHFYWVLEEIIDIHRWLELQNRLLAVFGADLSVGNASRVMRLAGSWHTEAGQEPIQCRYLPGSELCVSPEVFEALPVIPESFIKRTGAMNYPKFDTNALTRTLEELIQERGNSVEKLFDWPNHDFKQRSDGSWDGNCPFHQSKSETAFHVSQSEGKWLWNCRNSECSASRGGDWFTYQHALQTGNGGIGAPYGKDAWDLARLLAASTSVQVPIPSKVSPRHLPEAPEPHRDDDGELVTDRLNELTRFRSYLEAKDICPEGLLQVLQERGRSLSVPAEVLFTGLLPSVGSLLPPTATIKVLSLVERAIWWQGWVAESGSRKSPAMRTVTGPLWRLQKEAREQHALLHEAWKQEESEDKTPEPLPRHYLTSDTTIEALARLVNDNGMRGGLFREVEELAGLFKGFDQYRQGKTGSDQETMLSLYDGSPIKRDRVKREDSAYVEATAVSILGTIQPKVLLELATDEKGELSDDNGLWSRFEFAFIPEVRHRLREEQADHLTYLHGLFRNVEQFRATAYELTGDAAQLFVHWHDEILQPELQQASGGFKAYLAKKTGRLARLCLLLHVIDGAAIGQHPSPTIEDPALVQRAIALSDWFTGQVAVLYQLNAAEQQDNAAILQTIVDWMGQPCRAEQWVGAKNLREGIRALRQTKNDQIRDYMRDLVRLGFAKGEGAGIHFRVQSVINDRKHDKTVIR